MTALILDCDPGIDDALALALLAGSPSVELVGVTTVAGNVGLDRTTANALALREFLALGDVPVHAGAGRALLRDQIHAAHVHGDNGLAGVDLPAPARGADPGHAVDFIISSLRARPGEITLVAVGPLTNIALAVRLEPRIVEWARELVVMGGTFTRGNTNPAAEFNILTDPEAAAIVFGAGWKVTQITLDVTLTALVTTAVLDRMRPLGRLADLVVPCCQFYGQVTTDGGPALHDAVAVAYALDPGLVHLTPAQVDVETAGRFSSGMTVTRFTADGGNALVATGLDVGGFWELLIASYERLAERLG
ncbi:nucleoside hydrolase [Nonomuraea sp. NPDC050310]|uniref:nucleoside hydrolase n=1 Tax=unclassified Nonomuraea TaxID=2593643 RepID=UPI00340AD40A